MRKYYYLGLIILLTGTLMADNFNFTLSSNLSNIRKYYL